MAEVIRLLGCLTWPGRTVVVPRGVELGAASESRLELDWREEKEAKSKMTKQISILLGFWGKGKYYFFIQ